MQKLRSVERDLKVTRSDDVAKMETQLNLAHFR
jgi:uncharacterized protein YprB with RNaseH-like and TPR domain